MGKILANIKYISELPFNKFVIPPYQRPYRWTQPNVLELLQSIKDNVDNGEYRIGSIIVNPEEGLYNLVDGQQRITTLVLIFKFLNSSNELKVNFTYRHKDSKVNIYRNYNYIKDWISQNLLNDDEKNKFRDYILNECSVVLIEVENISEAFQMFDSQNGRGKELEAYNLLKAFHIRAIDETEENVELDNKKEIDRRWERAVSERIQEYSNDNLLKYVINDLFRIRKWNRKDVAYDLNKKQINEFKGIQIHKGKVRFPLENIGLLMYEFSKGGSQQACHRMDDSKEKMNAFVNIEMPIINGILFFDYIESFILGFKYLFINDIPADNELSQFKEDFNKYCLKYEGAYRDGDRYIRDAYIALIMTIFDKFGNKGVSKYYKILYTLVYRVRLQKQAVKYVTMAKEPLNYVSIIANATKETDLQPLSEMAQQDIKCVMLRRCREVMDFILVNKIAKIINQTEDNNDSENE